MEGDIISCHVTKDAPSGATSHEEKASEEEGGHLLPGAPPTRVGYEGKRSHIDRQGGEQPETYQGPIPKIPCGTGLLNGEWNLTPTQFNDAAALPLVQKRVDAKDPKATEYLAQAYYNGRYGLEKDVPRAVELWTEAARLGDPNAHCILGIMYCDGEAVEEDVARSVRHWQQAAIQGHPESRLMLGAHEYGNGNNEVAVQHWMIAAKLGCKISLNRIKDMFVKGHATKARYAEALIGYQTALEETKSPQREEAKNILN
ncbi:hypothetical protein THAOC_05529 [Thalassiosira oceanica]|uniref:Uncharacterized protein n=1 Tax=Thalassiosira oceanica TaxID=159749 RepID=K0T718_THAOC|nr:hypothetical protein THAOC_05529 [Thalassiosira oceanica]|eukprot:EJK72894.1 hypothetical protein THAOC_05529 [Thalassiosira oceanica]